MYALGMSDKDIQEQIHEIFGCNLSPFHVRDNGQIVKKAAI